MKTGIGALIERVNNWKYHRLHITNGFIVKFLTEKNVCMESCKISISMQKSERKNINLLHLMKQLKINLEEIFVQMHLIRNGQQI